MKTITQLIAELEVLYAKHGDVPCLVWNHWTLDYVQPVTYHSECNKAVLIESI